MSNLPPGLEAAQHRYDYFIDIIFAVVTGGLLYIILSQALLRQAAAEHRAINAAWRAANDALEERVRERTRALEQANAQLQAEITERARAEQDLQLVLELSRKMASTHDARRLQDLILQHLKKMIGYSMAGIWKYQGDQPVRLDDCESPDGELVRKIFADTVEYPGDKLMSEQRWPVTIGDTHALSSNRAICCPDLPNLTSDTCSWMRVPMVLEDRLIGILRLEHEQAGYFTSHHAKLATVIANQAAVAIENARLAEDSQRVAVLNERARLARDLHDSIIQSVYGIMWSVRSAQETLPNDPARAAKLLDKVVATAGASLVDLRSLIFELRPELIEQHGLAGLLAHHAESLQVGRLIDFNMEISDEPELPLPTKEALYRIAQEALQNAFKHSQAHRVSLRLQNDPGRVMLEVEDDGVGFDTGAPRPGHLGLLSMKERANQAGGHLAIKSAIGQGTRIQVQVPMAQAPAAA